MSDLALEIQHLREENARLALRCGYVPVHLGASRLRTETAAVTAAAAVYFRYMQ